LANSQLDRLALASLRPLEELGYYTLALSVASGLGRMVQPMFNALYPRFNRLVARNDEATLGELYHLSSQLLAVVIAAVAAILIVFSRDVLWLWSGDASVAERAALPMAILVTGSALNGLVNIPYALQLAHGWTRLAAGLNAASLLIALPLCLWLVPRYGMAGAATIWLLANLVSLMVGVPLMHRRLLIGQVMRWAFRDTAPPLLAGLCAALIMAALLPSIERSLTGFALLLLASGATLLSCIAATPSARTLLRDRSKFF
jgi:O-antigen/teichoic acid export membrane protein